MSEIIIIDDHPVLVEGLAAVLNASAHNVIAKCGTVAEGKSAIESLAPSVVITDLKFPEQSGLELLDWVRANRPALPVILYTGMISGGQARQAIENGVNAILSKDVDPDEVLDCIKAVERGQNWINREAMSSAMTTGVDDHKWQGLSAAEAKIAKLAAQGLRNREIAERARIIEGTVKVHLNRVFRKLNIKSRMELIKHYGE